MTVQQYRQKVQGISENLIDWVSDILENDLEKDVLDLVKEQLGEGKRGDGSSLPYYNPRTLISKKRRGAVIMGNRIALIDRGQFWASFFLNVYQGSIIVDADDKKRDMLVERYGDEIFLISKKQMEYLSTLVRPLLMAKINQYLAQ